MPNGAKMLIIGDLIKSNLLNSYVIPWQLMAFSLSKKNMPFFKKSNLKINSCDGLLSDEGHIPEKPIGKGVAHTIPPLTSIILSSDAATFLQLVELPYVCPPKLNLTTHGTSRTVRKAG